MRAFNFSKTFVFALLYKIAEMLWNIFVQFIAALLDRKQSDQLLPVVQ